MAVKRRMWLSSIGSWNDGVLEWWSSGIVGAFGETPEIWRADWNPDRKIPFRRGRRNQHARRVRYPEECVRSAQLEHRHVCLCAQRGFSPLQRLVAVRLCRTAVSAIMPALPVAAGFKPAGRTG